MSMSVSETGTTMVIEKGMPPVPGGLPLDSEEVDEIINTRAVEAQVISRDEDPHRGTTICDECKVNRAVRKLENGDEVCLSCLIR